MKVIITFAFLLFTLALPAQALAATLSLSPTTGTFNRSCPFTLDINLNTGGVQTDGTDSILFYDNSRFTATSISPGTIYADYPGNNVDDPNGKVTVSGLASVSQPFTGSGKLATINFTVKENAPAGATQIKFDFDPNNMTKTTDSNVVQRGTVQDVLSSVVNGNYTVGTGTCTQVQVSPTPGSGSKTIGQGAPTYSTPAAEPKVYKTLPSAGGNEQWTATLTIVGAALTILGILGLALL